jgi:hypothetical protein
MSQADLIQSLKEMLMSAADKFDNPTESLGLFLTTAAQDFGQVRPHTLLGPLTLVADQPNYPAPADLVQPKFSRWGRKEQRDRKPYNSNWVGRLPKLQVINNAGTRELWLDPAPTQAQITDLGSAYQYFYFAAHQVAEAVADTTVRPEDRSLLLVRALAEALFALAARGSTQPITLGAGGGSIGSMPKNGTPASLAEKAMDRFHSMARGEAA